MQAITRIEEQLQPASQPASQQSIAKVRAKQYQTFTELGYTMPVGSLEVTPLVGLSYQRLTTRINENTDLNIQLKPYNVFTQYAGANVAWKNENIRLKVGAFYEQNNESNNNVRILGNQSAQFETGRLGNAVVWKASADVAITPQLKLGLQLNHRQAVSKAKLNQTNVVGKLEYQF